MVLLVGYNVVVGGFADAVDYLFTGFQQDQWVYLVGGWSGVLLDWCGHGGNDLRCALAELCLDPDTAITLPWQTH